jgi:hypothetical protein
MRRCEAENRPGVEPGGEAEAEAASFVEDDVELNIKLRLKTSEIRWNRNMFCQG